MLIVDDDDNLSELAAMVVTSGAHPVVGYAGNVGGAFARAVELRPDSVWVDVGLPDDDGFSLTQQLVARPGRMGVVLMSSDSHSAKLSAAHLAGATGFIPRNQFSSAELSTYVDQG